MKFNAKSLKFLLIKVKRIHSDWTVQEKIIKIIMLVWQLRHWFEKQVGNNFGIREDDLFFYFKLQQLLFQCKEKFQMKYISRGFVL